MPATIETPVKHTKISAEHGHVVADSPASLKEAGNAALAARDLKRATHMYTLGIDLLLGERARAGAAALTSAEWYALSAGSEGVLHQLLSNRSYVHLSQGDAAAAAEDATYCTMASPGFAKGHLRLQAALEALERPASERRAACARALRACPGSAQLREAMASLPEEAAEAEAAELAAQLDATRRCAEDPMDPRRHMASGDWGSILATGAHGVEKDVVAAERYLRAGADGGDAPSQRNLGMLLLELDRPEEAAEQLRAAASAGDEQAAETLRQLADEAARKVERARFQLGVLASQGDERAIEMLRQLENGGGL